jgi:hypothetical protein
MNKKIIFLSAGIMMSVAASAQKDKLKEATKQLETATTAAKANADLATIPYTKAKEAIDLAVTNPDTKDKPETWKAKAGIYIGMQENPKLNADNPYKEGIVALKKAMELDPKLTTDKEIVQMTANGAFYAYNDGINAYNKSQFKDGYELFKQSASLLGPDKDKRFILMSVVDTIRAKSIMFMGRNAYYAALADNGKNADMLNNAVVNLNASKTSVYLSDEEKTEVYLSLAQAYDKLGDKANQTAILKEGLQKFPNDKNLMALDLNAAITGNDQSTAIQKMQAAIDKDPSNPDYHENMGMLYYAMAYPKGGNPPAASAEYSGKAEAAYKKAIELSSDNGTYNFQLGSLYYNNASRLLEKMNALGNSKAEQAQYDVLNKQKDEMFSKALPYLEKAKDVFYKRKTSLNTEEGKEFISTLTGLKEIYSRMDQPDKAADAKKILSEVSQ